MQGATRGFFSFLLAKEAAIFETGSFQRTLLSSPQVHLPFFGDELPFCGHASAEGCATELKAVLFHEGAGFSLQLANNELSVQSVL